MVKRVMRIVLLSCVVALSGANAAGLEFAVGGWQQDPNGTFGYKALKKK